MSSLEIRGAYKAFGTVPALRGVDLTVQSGSLLAVLGPSGCGKTTLLRCVAGFEWLDAGEIRAGSRPLAGPGLHLPPERRRIAVVPQDGALFPHLSVAANVGYGLDRGARRAGRVSQTLELVGLSGFEERMPHQLSGGQQQRVAVARALAPRPPLVLLDEPFSALDAGLRADVRRDIRAALRADGATAILVTHDQGEALSVADMLAVMREGRIVQSGPPEHVYRQPTDPWVAGFLGEAVLLPAAVQGTLALTALGPVRLAGSPPGGAGEVTVFLRPEQVQLAPATADDAADGTAAGAVATVLRKDFHGHDAMLLLGLPEGPRISARVFDPAESAPAVGDEVRIRIPGEALAYPR